MDLEKGFSYKIAMSNRYLTHLGTVLFLHLLVLIGSFTIVQEQRLNPNFSLGPPTLKLKLAGQALFQYAVSPRVARSTTASAPKERTVTTHQPKVQEPVSKTPSVGNEAALAGNGAASSLSGSSDGTADAKAVFKAELRAEIEKHKSYPPMSRRLGQTGTVVVAFTLLEDGHIIDVRLDTPSRFERLNESAIEAVKSVHKFRPMPKEWGQAKMDFTVPVNYLTI